VEQEVTVARQIPRPFKYEWGSGQVVEEVSAPNPHYEPAIQLLVCEGGEHDGEEQLRFCFYSPRGAFQRHPMVIDQRDIEELRAGLKHAPRIRALLERLASG
jgi:hypothetical protein